MKRVVLAALTMALAAGCGGQQSTMDPQTRNRLTADVEAVKAAASSKDRPTAETALATLNRDIAAAQAHGKLHPQAAGRILTAADRVAEDMRALPAPPPPPPPEVTAPPETSIPNPVDDIQDLLQKQIHDRLEQLKKHGGHKGG